MTKNEIPDGYLPCVAYLRVSSRRQETEGHGNDSQLSNIKRFCELKKLHVIQVFRESGFSGDSRLIDRPAGKELVKFLASNSKLKVVVDSFTRQSRNLELDYQDRKVIEALGSEFISASEDFGDSIGGGFAKDIYLRAAQFLKDSQNEQNWNRIRSRLIDGYYCFSKLPFWLKYSAENKSVIERIEPYATFFQTELKAIIAQAKTKSQAYSDFNSKAKLIKENQFYDYLSNPLIAGYYESMRYEVPFTKGKLPALITLEEFNKLQSLKKLKNQLRRTDLDEVFPLRGIVRCSECKNRLTSGFIKKTFTYYWCHTKHCTEYNKTIKKDELESQFLEMLNLLQPKQSEILALELIFKNYVSQLGNGYSAEILEKQAQSKSYEVKISNLHRSLEDESDPAIQKTIRARIRELALLKVEVEEQLEAVENNEIAFDFSKYDQTLKKFFELSANYKQNWLNSDKEGKILLISMVCGDLFYDHKEKCLNRQKASIYEDLQAVTTPKNIYGGP